MDELLLVVRGVPLEDGLADLADLLREDG